MPRMMRLDLGGLDRVAAGGRLVEQQDLGLARQRAGDLEPLQRAIGQAAGRPLGRCGKPDARERRRRALRGVARFCRRDRRQMQQVGEDAGALVPMAARP